MFTYVPSKLAAICFPAINFCPKGAACPVLTHSILPVRMPDLDWETILSLRSPQPSDFATQFPLISAGVCASRIAGSITQEIAQATINRRMIHLGMANDTSIKGSVWKILSVGNLDFYHRAPGSGCRIGSGRAYHLANNCDLRDHCPEVRIRRSRRGVL